MKENTYNGYTNYETWLVSLHLDNDFDLYETAQFHSKRILSQSGTLDRGIAKLASWLRAWVNNGVRNSRLEGFRLMREDLEKLAPLKLVNWQEIAEGYQWDYFESLHGFDVIVHSDNAFNGTLGYIVDVHYDKFIVNLYKADGKKWMIAVDHELTYNELTPLRIGDQRTLMHDAAANVIRAYQETETEVSSL